METDISEDVETTTFDPEIIQQAKDMGWVDKSDWHGNPDHWRGPDEYVRRGQEVLPIVRSQVERLKAEQQKREAEFDRQRSESDERQRRQDEAAKQLQARLERQEAEFKDRQDRNEKMSRIALERQRQTFLEQIDAAKYNAVAAGDTKTYAGLLEREKQFYREAQTEDEQYQPRPVQKPAERTEVAEDRTPQNQPAPLTSRDARTRDDWIEKNAWFQRSNELNLEAQRIHVELWEKHPGIDLADNLDRVTSEMKKRHPDKFGIDTKQQETSQGRSERTASHSFVEGSASGVASGGNSSSRRKGWNDIHADDRALAERSYIKAGFYGKDVAKAREEYAKDYWEINE